MGVSFSGANVDVEQAEITAALFLVSKDQDVVGIKAQQIGDIGLIGVLEIALAKRLRKLEHLARRNSNRPEGERLIAAHIAAEEKIVGVLPVNKAVILVAASDERLGLAGGQVSEGHSHAPRSELRQEC